jgi:hypothetical protein
VPIAVFNTDIMVGVNVSGKELVKRASKQASNRKFMDYVEEIATLWDAERNKGTQGLCAVKESGATIVLADIPDGKFITGSGTLVHELVHATQALMRIRGIKQVEESDEVQAYLMGYLYDSCLRKIL